MWTGVVSSDNSNKKKKNYLQSLLEGLPNWSRSIYLSSPKRCKDKQSKVVYSSVLLGHCKHIKLFCRWLSPNGHGIPTQCLRSKVMLFFFTSRFDVRRRKTRGCCRGQNMPRVSSQEAGLPGFFARPQRPLEGSEQDPINAITQSVKHCYESKRWTLRLF